MKRTYLREDEDIPELLHRITTKLTQRLSREVPRGVGRHAIEHPAVIRATRQFNHVDGAVRADDPAAVLAEQVAEPTTSVARALARLEEVSVEPDVLLVAAAHDLHAAWMEAVRAVAPQRSGAR